MELAATRGAAGYNRMTVRVIGNNTPLNEVRNAVIRGPGQSAIQRHERFENGIAGSEQLIHYDLLFRMVLLSIFVSAFPIQQA